MGNNQSHHLHRLRRPHDDKPGSSASSAQSIRPYSDAFVPRGNGLNTNLEVAIPNPEIGAVTTSAESDAINPASQTLTTAPAARDDKTASGKRNSFIRKDQKEMSSQATVPCQVCLSYSPQPHRAPTAGTALCSEVEPSTTTVVANVGRCHSIVLERRSGVGRMPS